MWVICVYREYKKVDNLEFEDIWNVILVVIFGSFLNVNVSLNNDNDDNNENVEYLLLSTKEKREYFEFKLFKYLIKKMPEIDENTPRIEQILVNQVVSIFNAQEV